ncbi:hypothetical protein [Novosphingobium sp. MD-1]|uniref:hypothetical protein n=1 Tax=Novosphingobium sp. MD-1 TaxID=1630648 RepID=UPI000F7EE447|nr:hypothetical protein [Novosphingobium sp. MD-1]
MSRRNIGDADWPADEFRVDRAVDGKWSSFETERASKAEDKLRARLIRKAVARHLDTLDTEAALALAYRLEQAGNGGEAPDTLASSVHMRNLRQRVCSEFWRLVEGLDPARINKFTVIPATWEIRGGELWKADPRRLLGTLRSVLYSRCRATDALGWIIAVIHGEHDPIEDVYRLHVHGLAYGDMVDVIDRLREVPNFRTEELLGTHKAVYRRVRMTRKPLTNLPAPVTYLVQGFWPAKALFISSEGKRKRGRTKRRIADPRHSEVLLWLDRWGIDDLTLMVGLRMTKTGLKQTKLVS